MSDRSPRRLARSPYVFVVGCPRSGTTLLQRMLDAHPRLAIANDTHFIPRAVQAVTPSVWLEPARARWLTQHEALVSWARSYHRFERLGLDEVCVNRAARRSGSYADFVSRLYREFAAARGKELGGEKTPDYVRCLPLLHELFPDVQSVHIVRDGRDVALSTLEWARETKGPARFDLWREEPVAVCALWWRWQVGSGRRDGAKVRAGSYLEVSYERLVRDPAATLHEVADFLGLADAKEMLSFNAGKERLDPSLSAKRAWRSPTPGLRDWRTQMDERSIELFEALAGDLLGELGYPRAFPGISSSIARVALRSYAWWEEELQRRDAKLRATVGIAEATAQRGG
ncbi:MAG TPA: sulfotransferase [Vicinamibacteria bacterium]|nr:sulfotransferase [Vicinamibacteria bacterium]